MREAYALFDTAGGLPKIFHNLYRLFFNGFFGLFCSLFVFSVSVYLYRQIHKEEYRRDDNGEADEVAAEYLLKIIEWVALVRFHKEHIVRVEEIVEYPNGDCHRHEQKQAFGNGPCSRLYIAADGEHKRIENKKNVTDKAAYVHKVKEGKLCPGGEEYRHYRRGNTDGIKKIVNGFRGLEHMESDKKNIDGAKVKREVVFCPKSRDKKHDGFEYLAEDDKTADRETKTLATLFTAFFVQ